MTRLSESEVEKKKIEQALSEMAEETRVESKKISDLIRSGEVSNLKKHYQIGSSIIKLEKTIPKKYDSLSVSARGQIDLLKIVHGLDAGTTCRARFFAAYFTLNEALKSGLSYEHFRVLITVSDEEKRKEFFDKSIQEGWSSTQLSKKVKAFKESKKSSGSKSFSWEKAVSKVETFARKTLDEIKSYFDEQFEKTLLDHLLQISFSDRDEGEETLGFLEQTVKGCSELSNAIAAITNDLSKTLEQKKKELMDQFPSSQVDSSVIDHLNQYPEEVVEEEEDED